MSNTTRHLRQKFPDVRHYGDADYDRLEWLEVTMPMYLEDVKKVAAIQASSSRRRPRAPDRSSPEHQERSNKRARFGDAGCADASSAVTSRSIPLPCAATTETLPDDAPVDTLPDGYSGQPGAVILEDKHDGGVYVDSRSASTLLTTEKVKWKRKESDLMSQIVPLNRCNS
ncbi:hypothetical protein HPB48_024448 [Haemaphysalis longicornis]|uniref:Uncharacterized protein n=1 Tax=Haemaphysalis longicornis TaxID=44386 RepID=A0A9J6H8Q0_HAELO|nr:hypothetical protein HPB48_024448 [Haemaphysalis longicornis]